MSKSKPKLTITIVERTAAPQGPERYSAFLGGEQLMQAYGSSPAEALGMLILDGPARFGVEMNIHRGGKV